MKIWHITGVRQKECYRFLAGKDSNMRLGKKRHAMLKKEFIELLQSTGREGVDDLLAFLETSDFYLAPARVEHGCAYPGGLLEHTMDVYHILRDKLAPGSNPVWNIVAEDPSITNDVIILVALLHDFCKIGIFNVTHVNRKNYEPDVVSKAAPYQVKHDKDGDFIWESVPGYRIDETVPLGAGEKSVILAQKYIRLTDQEIYALRWHRGYGEECHRMVSDVFANYPLALALYEADLEATFITEKDKLR